MPYKEEKKQHERIIVQSILETINKKENAKYGSLKELESPDFICTSDEGITIGIEHTKCYSVHSNDTKEQNGKRIIKGGNTYEAFSKSLEKLCRSVVNDLDKSNQWNKIRPNYFSIIFHHFLLIDGFRKNERRVIYDEIKSFFYSALTTNKKIDGKYIQSVCLYHQEWRKEDKFEISPDMLYYEPRIEQLKKDPVIESIRDKERKLKEIYKKNHKDVTQWWLVVEITADSHLRSRGYKMPQNIESDFDRIFLVNSTLLDASLDQIWTKS